VSARHALKLLGVSLSLSACFGRGPVTRIADGEELSGRYIRGDAYAAYLRATLRDEAGDRSGALKALDEALSHDPSSPEILTRIGEITCRAPAASGDAERALAAFRRAADLDPTYAPAWLGLARCLETAGEFEEALAFALEALAHEPERVETTELIAGLLRRAGREREALTWLDALTALTPAVREAHEAQLRAAVALGDHGREQRARQALSRLGVPSDAERRQALDVALSNDDLPLARRLAGELHLRPSAFLLYAVERSPNVALAQARLLLAAEPENSDAFSAALAAADLLGDEAEFARVLGTLAEAPEPASAPALKTLAAVIARRSGAEAAAAVPGAR
jgi:tetratricopeptide (TPR) repeat protein